MLGFGRASRVMIVMCMAWTFQRKHPCATAQQYLSTDSPANVDNPSIFYDVFVDESFNGLFITGLRDDAKLAAFLEFQLTRRRGDAFLFTVRKYFINTFNFIVQQRNEWEALPFLPIAPDPMGQLGKPCTLPVDDNGQTTDDVLLAFLDGQINEHTLADTPDNEYIQSVLQPCTPPGYMPLLVCRPNGTGDLLCHCSPEDPVSRWTPFVYHVIHGLNNTANQDKEIACIGAVGAICVGNNDSLTCDSGLLCEETNPGGPKFCAGSLGQLARGFGGGIQFTEPQLNEILASSRKIASLAEVESHLIRVSSSFGVLGKDCDPRYWNWTTHALRHLFTQTDNTVPPLDQITLLQFYVELTAEMAGLLLPELFNHYVASVMRALGWLTEPNTQYEPDYLKITNARADYYDGGDSCLNEFPRMSCIQKPTDPVRGLCQCSTPQNLLSPVFNYVQDGDQCVGTVGTICTTMRGSGDHNCERGLVCESFVEDPFASIRIPGPLTHLEIKVCQRPKEKILQNTTTDIPSTKKSGCGPLVALDLFIGFLLFIIFLHVTHHQLL